MEEEDWHLFDLSEWDQIPASNPNQIILDQLQSEQGARFLRKRNRNIIIKVEEEVPELEDFRWMTLGQIKEMMAIDNMVNMDTRTVLSGLNVAEFYSLADDISLMTKRGKDFLLSATTNHSLLTINNQLSWSFYRYTSHYKHPLFFYYFNI